MNERWFRLVQGIYLLMALYFELEILVLVYIGVLSFEALTNWRVPVIVSRLRFGKHALEGGNCGASCRFNIEAERLLRITVVFFLLISFVMFPESVWFFPWFVAAMLLMAGITNICPMVMFFQYFGFR